MNNKTKEHALIAANDIADSFTTGFCNNDMVGNFAVIIEKQMKQLRDVQYPDVYKLRDHIAITAMNGLMISTPATHSYSSNRTYTAEVAYQYADAMLKARGEV
jgi:uncharacterized protein YyaL (SSP411 family)